MSHPFSDRAGARQPETVGPFQILGVLGKGGMGVVYRARDLVRSRDVAVKVLSTHLEADDDMRERLMREAAVTRTIRHRNVITILETGEEAGRIYIATELLRGEALASRVLATPPLSFEQKLDLMIQACDGLAAAHAKGVVHRDVTPGNLFVESDGGLKILDFGIARLADSILTRSGLIIGTPGFLSPEQARGQRVDERADIFSTAAVFYYVFTRRKPFDGRSLPVVLQKVLTEVPAPIAAHEAPQAVADIIARGLAKDRTQRYQRMPDMLLDLIRFKREWRAGMLLPPPPALAASVEAPDAVRLDDTTTGAATALASTSGLSSASEIGAAETMLPTTGPAPDHGRAHVAGSGR